MVLYQMDIPMWFKIILFNTPESDMTSQEFTFLIQYLTR
ncbi:hypothetical protein BH23THE1_BH23THE1_27340 [soil metagenome]